MASGKCIHFKAFLPRTGEASPAGLEYPEPSGLNSNGAWKGGVSWHNLPSGKARHTRLTLPTSRRNSCAGIRLTGATMISWSGNRVADCGHPLAGGWLCHGASNFPIDPARSAHRDPAIWQARHCASMVLLQGGAEAIATTILAVRARSIVAECRSKAGRHIVIEAGGARHRLLMTKLDCPHCSGFLLPDNAALPARMAALSSFLCWQCPSGSFAPTRHLRPTRYQRHRLEQMLQILDLHARDPGERPSLRGLAKQILRADVDHERAIEWKTSSTRRQVQRLVAGARRLANDGYRELLACRMPKC